jgi:predicted XRE-type DNA-binding protein
MPSKPLGSITMRHKKNDADEGFVESSGNVFADLGPPDANELLVKADLMHAINREVSERGLTQQETATLANITQSDVSRIARGKMDAFSKERLIDILRHLGIDVEIRFHRRPNGGIGTLCVRELVESA